jgi:hypothetical protein
MFVDVETGRGVCEAVGVVTFCEAWIVVEVGWLADADS